MDTKPVGYKAKPFKAHNLAFFLLIALIMTTSSPAVAGVAIISAPQRFAKSPVVASSDTTRTSMPNGLVDVGGHRLMIHCTGYGSPTVILEAGQGADSYSWAQVQIGGDSSYRVCSYDRANLGESDAARKPRTYLDMARDLHALLKNANIEGPYILVGHSGGGLLTRVFTDQFPEEVIGLVLVDAAHPEMGPRLLAGLPPKSLFESKAIREWRIWLSWMSDSEGSLYKDQEGLDTKANNAQVKAAKPLGDLPLVVISRSPDNTTFEGAPTLPAETNARLRQIWQDLQSELAGLSSNSTQVIAAQAGHAIPTEAPELVIEAIRKLVNEVRDQMGVAIPPTLPTDQTDAVHTARILRVVERQEEKDGMLIYYDDIYFKDAAGDAIFTSVVLTSGNLLEDEHVSGGFITTSGSEQKREAVLNVTWVCRSQETFVVEIQFIDQALNKSEPVELTFPCPAPQKYKSPFPIIGTAVGIGLLVVAAWLMVLARRARRAADTQI